MGELRILVSGDQAVSVEMGSEISIEVNKKVLMLQAELENNPVEGVTETLPTYASLMVHYDPEKILFDELAREIRLRAEKMHELPETVKRIVEIPVCYGGDFGPDLEYCAELEKTTPQEIIRIHSEHDYYVYMLGFAPGHPYAARFDEPFSFKRRETARIKIPARSVVVQLNLSDLIPFEQPCGWNIIGQTPCEICDYTRKDPFLVHAGEWTRYKPISVDEFHRIRKAVETGKWKPNIITQRG